MGFITNTKSTLPSLSQSGQAATEYLLILVVSAGIILGVVYQFNTAFQSFAKNYFGEYLSCLLETGELPALGDNEGTFKDGCDANFESFSLANGRPSTKKSSNKNSYLNKNSNQGNNGARSAESNKSTSSNKFRPNTQQSGKKSSSLTARNQLKINNRRGIKASTKAEVIILKEEGLNELNSIGNVAGQKKFKTKSKLKNRTRDSGEEYIIRYIYITDKKDSNSNIVSTRKDIKNKGSQENLAQLPIKRGTAAQEKEEKDFSFGSFLKYILIAGIIIAIVIFVGGQLLQISKSME